jgi:hypothetical protein
MGCLYGYFMEIQYYEFLYILYKVGEYNLLNAFKLLLWKTNPNNILLRMIKAMWNHKGFWYWIVNFNIKLFIINYYN